MTPFDYITAGAGIIKGFTDASASREHNREMVRSIDAQINDLGKRIGTLKKAAAARKGVVRGRYGEKVRDVNSILGDTIYNFMQSEDKVAAQTGLMRSEGALTAEDQNKAKRGWRSEKESLTEWLGNTINEIESYTTSQIAQAENQIKELRVQREAADSATRGLGAYLPF